MHPNLMISPRSAQSEESLRVLRCSRGERSQTHAANGCDERGGVGNKRGFAAFVAVWRRREIGRIGLNHDPINWNRFGGLSHFGSIPKVTFPLNETR
jgi:hypothetical protein